jgi:diguanylate cyclase (GGDEF)-like protein
MNSFHPPMDKVESFPAQQAQMVLLLASLLTLVLYALWPDARSASLQLLCLIPVVGMLVLKPNDLILSGALTLGLLVITLLSLWLLPLGAPFDLIQDGLSGLMVCLMLPMLVGFAYRYALRREAMGQHHQELTETLGKMQQMAARDSMTGLHNQQHMSEALNQEFKRAQRAGTPLSIALLDLDHLRTYNEQQGHEAGDQLMCRFAQQLAEAFRENEIVARWSGGTFMVVFTDSQLEQAGAALERLRQTQIDQGLGLTFSGSLVGRREGDRLDDLFNRAQTSLQRAKAQGRDRIICTP